MKQQRARERYALAETENNLRIAEQQPTVNPNTPKIPIYLRPAEDRDISGVTAIYNHYVTNTDLTEDQEPISELAMGEIFLLARKEDFPFIVAIAGKAPEKGRKKNSETVLGYARAEGFYGLGGTSKGRSRFTAQIEFWVHHKYLRKGVGRSLLDRMLQCTASMHAGKDGYDFVIPDPKDKAVYGTFGGAGGDRKYHQIMLQRPIEIRNDPDHAWLKTWLETRFFFFQVARLQSIARTKTAGGPLGAKWMDVVIFQFEATQPGQFPIFL
jgi:L-amino acid N-acyltransferase YncA